MAEERAQEELKELIQKIENNERQFFEGAIDKFQIIPRYLGCAANRCKQFIESRGLNHETDPQTFTHTLLES